MFGVTGVCVGCRILCWRDLWAPMPAKSARVEPCGIYSFKAICALVEVFFGETHSSVSKGFGCPFGPQRPGSTAFQLPPLRGFGPPTPGFPAPRGIRRGLSGFRSGRCPCGELNSLMACFEETHSPPNLRKPKRTRICLCCFRRLQGVLLQEWTSCEASLHGIAQYLQVCRASCTACHKEQQSR